MYEDGQDHSPRNALPLVDAAARLGITPDALRKRLRRGKVEGFRRDGRVYVVLPERRDAPGPEAPGPGPERWQAPPPPTPDQQRLAVAARADLARLIRENARLQGQIDRLLQMQEREQVLRQQMQTTIDRLTERIALPGPSNGQGQEAAREHMAREQIAREETARLESRLKETEFEFSLLKGAVQELLAYLERRRTS